MAARRDDARGRAKRPSGGASSSSSTPAASPTTKTGTNSSTSGSGRMELMLAAAESFHQPPPPPPPPPAVAYHQFAPYPSSSDAPTSSASKHKRVKKSDGDEWAAGGMRISNLVGPPPPTSQHSISSLTAPTSSGASLASILSAASPLPTATAPSPTASVFQAPPAPILSFADTERRRAASGPQQTNGKSAGVSSVSRGLGGAAKSSTGPLSMLEVFFPADAPTAAANASDAAGGRDSATTKSLKRKRRADPTQLAGAAAASASDYDLLRFGVDVSKLVPQGLVDRVDAKMDRAFIATLIRSHVAHWGARAGFGSHFLAELTPLLTAYYPCHYPTILDHVLVNFLFKRPEFMDLLLKPMIEKLQKLGESATGAKYPVIDAFARTCYYLYYQEAAATTTTATTAAGVNPSDGGAAGTTTTTSAADCARHDFACETLLQCLLESNTDKFLLSPAIAACAAHCSDSVLEKLWRQIVGAWLTEEDRSSSNKSSADTKDEDEKTAPEAQQELKSKRMYTSKATLQVMNAWRIMDPLQQAFELLEEEQKFPPPLLHSRGGDSQHLHQPRHHASGGRASCRLASALVRMVLLDTPLKSDTAVLSSSLVRRALEAAWGGGGSTFESSALLLEYNSDNEFAQLLHSLVHAAATSGSSSLSVRRTNWFARHVLRFLLSPAAVPGRKRRFAEIATSYMPLLLGSSAREDHGEQASPTKTVKNVHDSGSASTSRKRTYEHHHDGNDTTRLSGAWDTMEVGEMLTVPEIIEKLVFVLEMLDISHPEYAADFLHEWTTAWTSKSSRAGVVPWGYVHAAVLAAVDEDVMSKFRYVRPLFQTLAAQTCRRHFQQLRALPAVERGHILQTAIAKRLATLLDELLLTSPTAFTHSLLRDVVDEIRQFEDTRSGTVFKNVVLLCLGEGKRSEVSSPPSSSPIKRSSSQKAQDAAALLSLIQRSPRIEVELRVLVSLLHLASLNDEAGRFARVQLSTRPIVRLLTGLMNDVADNRFKMTKLVDLLDAVISRRAEDDNDVLGSEWTRQHIVQQFVATAYSVGMPAISDRLVGLVQSLASRSGKQNDGVGASRANTLWATLRQCTRLCCGCSRNDIRDSRSLVDQFHVSTAGNFAELVKVLLCSSSHSPLLSSSSAYEAQRVMDFVQQELTSCHANESRMNVFLLLVLQKMAAVDRQPRSCLSVVQLAVFSIGVTTRDHIRILQLQVLKALCSRLASIRSRRPAVVASKGRWRTDDSDDCRRCEELVCNERLQNDLRRIVDAEGVGANSSRASVMLAQSVLKFAAEVEHRRQFPLRVSIAVK